MDRRTHTGRRPSVLPRAASLFTIRDAASLQTLRAAWWATAEARVGMPRPYGRGRVSAQLDALCAAMSLGAVAVAVAVVAVVVAVAIAVAVAVATVAATSKAIAP